MSCAPIDLVGSPGVPTTQGLGRLIGQYTKSTKLIALLRGVYQMGQDLDLLFQKIARMLDINDDASQDSPNTSGGTVLQWFLASDGVTPASSMSVALVSQPMTSPATNCYVRISWPGAGSPVGTFGLAESGDGVNFDAIGPSDYPLPEQPTGSAGVTSLILQEGQWVSPFIRATWTPTSGGVGAFPTGTFNTNPKNLPSSFGAIGAQLRGIGNLVGVTNVVPGKILPIPLTDAQYRLLIAARIYRNHVRGGTTPQIIHAIQLVMPDLITGALLRVVEIGYMTTLIIVGRPVEDWEAGIFAIPGGISMTKGALLPRPHGVAFATYWQGIGCFCFGSSLASDPYAPIMTGGHGWNTFNPANPTNNRTTTETGQWAGTF